MFWSPAIRKHAAVGACFLVFGSLAHGQTEVETKERPAWISELTPLTPGPHASIKPVVATFKLSWNNVLNAGDAYLVVEKATTADQIGKGILKGISAGRSTGLARALWPYDYETTADTDLATLLPLGFSHEEVERKERILYNTGFERRLDRIVTETTFYNTPEGDVADVPETKRRIYRFTEAMDILSTVLFVRSHELADNSVIKAVVFPFNRPYHTTMSVLGREERKFKGVTFDTICIEIEIQKIEKDLTLTPYQKLRKATLWVTDDEFRMPLELQSEIFVGFVSARSTGFDWIESNETSEEAVERVRKAGVKKLAKEREDE